MDIEQKREFLERYLLQQAKINRLYEQSRKNSDKKEYYQKQINSAITLRDQIENAICKLRDERESEILAQKYLCGKTLEETAGLLNYSKRQTERLHIKALEHFEI